MGRSVDRCARAYFSGDDYGQSVTADELIDEGRVGRIPTGLVDANGQPIYRRLPTVKFGFQSSRG